MTCTLRSNAFSAKPDVSKPGCPNDRLQPPRANFSWFFGSQYFFYIYISKLPTSKNGLPTTDGEKSLPATVAHTNPGAPRHAEVPIGSGLVKHNRSKFVDL
jgi:hypothetical protein